MLTLSHFFNIISQFLHQLLHNVTYTTHTAPCATPIHSALYLYTTHAHLHSTYTILCIMYCIWFSYIVLLFCKGYTIWRLLYWHVYVLVKHGFYSCIVNFITIILYVPETLAILVFHTYKYTYFKYCKYSSAPCNSK